MADTEEKKTSNGKWVDITKHDTILVIASHVIVGLLAVLGYMMAHH